MVQPITQQTVVTSPTPTPVVTPPPPTPTPATGCTGYATEANCQNRFQTLQAEIDGIRSRISEMQRLIERNRADIALLVPICHQDPSEPTVPPAPVIGIQGEKGDKGDKGDRGEKGEKGDPGEPGGAVNIDTLTQQVVNNLPPFTVRQVNADTGAIVGEEEVHLGGGFEIRLHPHRHPDE